MRNSPAMRPPSGLDALQGPPARTEQDLLEEKQEKERKKLQQRHREKILDHYRRLIEARNAGQEKAVNLRNSLIRKETDN